MAEPEDSGHATWFDGYERGREDGRDFDRWPCLVVALIAGGVGFVVGAILSLTFRG